MLLTKRGLDGHRAGGVLGGVAAVLLVCAPVAAQAQPAPEVLKGQIDEARRAGDVAAAARLADQLADVVEPSHAEALYVAAQLHARAGHREQAYLRLRRAVGAGFLDRERLLEDEAFAEYRREELFGTIVRKAWANGYISLLERPNREDVQKSPEILKALAFRPGERVADIGSGSGYFTLPVAKAVGPTGSVQAIDVASELLEYLEVRIKAQRVSNVTLKLVSRDDPQLPPGGFDTILMIDTIHYVKDRPAYVRKLLPGLAPGGRLVVIDYRPKPMAERPWGPPPEQQFPREQLDREMADAGFRVVASYDFLPEQFFVVYGPR